MHSTILHQNKNNAVGSSGKTFPIVAIGASAGGLEAISEILKNLPANTGMAYIYVQHLSPNHKSLLTTILSKITKMKVQEIEEMEFILPNNVYIIPPNKSIKVIDGHIKLLPRATSGSAISIDVLFTSLARTHKNNIIGIILSGNASDGLAGLKSIKQAGGLTIAQDHSAQASSMPDAAIDAGAVDLVLSPIAIAKALISISEKVINGKIMIEELNPESKAKQTADLNIIFELLIARTGVDFSHYKLPTIKRRLNHKMLEKGIKTVKKYIEILKNDEQETDLLYEDFLIKVTSFMRDKEVFHYLKKTLFPKLIKAKSTEESLRIWVPACATGEEVYSIAMIIQEFLDKTKSKLLVKIFGTDVSEIAVAKARLAEYSEQEIQNIPSKYQNDFLIKNGKKYKMSKVIRDMCVFAPQNILKDPPFSKMDFISYRNLLIYFDIAAQKKALSNLHFALNEKGFLMLGKAETVGTASPFFVSNGSKFKIFTRKMGNEGKSFTELSPRFHSRILSKKKSYLNSKTPIANWQEIESAMETAILDNYAPACVLINKELEVLQFKGPVSIFLKTPEGKASLSIMKMIRSDFAFELRIAIQQVLKTKKAITKSEIEITDNAIQKILSFDVLPLLMEWDDVLMLIVMRLSDVLVLPIYSVPNGKKNDELKDKKIKKLIAELNITRAEMNNIIESQEIIYEELQAANEEIVSSNEEFQTLNEELETSKEEIEATNEELVTSNHELQLRNDLLNESNEFSESIIATIHESVLVLTKDLKVKSANKIFYDKFHVVKSETEGRFLYDLGNRQWDIAGLIKALKESFISYKGFVNFEVTHEFPVIGERILLLNSGMIIQKSTKEPLALLAIEDVTERAKYYQKEKHSLSLIEASLDPLATINTSGKVMDLNQAMSDITGVPFNELIGTNFFDHFAEPQKAREVYEKVLVNGSVAESPLTILNKNGILTDVLFNGSVYKDEKGKVIGEVIVARDVTIQNLNAKELVNARNSAEEAAKIATEAKIKAESLALVAENALMAKQQFLSNMSHEIRTPMNAIIGFTNVLLKSELNDRQKEYLSAIKTSGDALIVLINDILDLAKISSGKMVFEKMPFRLIESLSTMLQLFETKIQEKHLELERHYDHRIPKYLIGDAARLQQIILNLVSNAVKFTHKGKISISVDVIAETPETMSICFSISDTGIGIEENKLEKIFENFQQASIETSRIYGGTGLGLAIVKQLVEWQGGIIKVKSTVNKGSVFSFQLDFQKSLNGVDVEETKEIQYPRNLNIKVLVVEDIPINQLLLKTLLDDFCFSYELASNGLKAIELLKKSKFDIVLMDLQMPEMNGFEATEYIRNTLHSTIPIIALTADVTTVDIDKCKTIGMDDYISKPIDEALLYKKILGLLKITADRSPEVLIKSKNKSGKTANVSNLDFLINKTRNNAALIKEMISLFLIQTPEIIAAMEQAIGDNDKIKLSAAAHKIIPSYAIMGIDSGLEKLTREIQDRANNGKIDLKTRKAFQIIKKLCNQSCIELEQYLKN